VRSWAGRGPERTSSVQADSDGCRHRYLTSSKGETRQPALQKSFGQGLTWRTQCETLRAYTVGASFGVCHKTEVRVAALASVFYFIFEAMLKCEIAGMPPRKATADGMAMPVDGHHPLDKSSV
jgi:hypothetical protein